MRLQQLHYTWAARGVEGRNRFQIAAMSAGLKSGPSASLLTIVKKICRYDPPRGRSDTRPISYGWFDFRNHRIAFSRIGLDPAKGKVGNFAAHVLVGSPSDMPASALAQRFESPFWWDGSTVPDLPGSTGRRWNFQLPSVAIDEISLAALDAHPDDPHVLNELANALLDLPKGKRLTVVEDSRALGRYVRTIAGFCPQALEGASFSTYEGAATFPFTVVGAVSPQPGREAFMPSSGPADPLSHTTLARLRESGAAGDELRAAAAVAATVGHEPYEVRRAFWACAKGIVAVATGSSVTNTELAVVLGTSDGAAYIARGPDGRRRIAEAIHAGAAGVSAVLPSAASVLTPSDLTDLNDAICERYTSTAQLGGCSDAAHIMDECARGRGATLLDAVLTVALADETAAATLRPADLVTLLIHAARSKDAAPVAPILRLAAPHASAMAREARIPNSYVAAAFRQSLVDDEADGLAKLTDVLTARPDVLSGIELSAAEADRSVALLDQMTRNSLPAALGPLIVALARPRTAEQLSELLNRLPILTAVALITRAARDAQDTMTSELSNLCDEFAAALLEQSLSSVVSEFHSLTSLAADLLSLSRSADHPKACRFLAGLSRRSQMSPLEVAAGSTGVAHPRLRTALAGVAVDRALEQVASPADVTPVWDELARQEMGSSTEDLLRRFLQRATRKPGSPGNDALLLWIARDLLPGERRLVSTSGKMQPPELQTLSLAVARSIHPVRLEQREQALEDSSRRIKAWWRTLIAHSRREWRNVTRPRHRLWRGYR